MKTNVMCSVLHADISGSGFQNVSWLRPQRSILWMWKQDLNWDTHVFNPDGGWQSEGTASDGATSISCSQQIKTECLPGSHALAENTSLSSVWWQLWNIRTPQYSQDRWDDVKSASIYERWIDETKLSIGYPRYLNGHLRPHVPSFACEVITTTHSN